MASSTIAPADPYLGTNVIDNQNDAVAWEVADFLFGAKSIKNIAEGNGTWGDAAVIGITAATFLIPPAKIALLGNKALRKVLAETITVNASTGSLPVVAKAIAKTKAEVEAELVRRGKLTYVEPLKAEEALRPMSEARFKSITSPEPETKFVPEGPPVDKYNPRNQGLGRPFDEDYDSFRDRDRNPAQEADDYIAMQGIGNKKKLLTKEELGAKDVESAQYYDKRKFTDDEIEERINRLTDKELNSPQLKRKKGESKEDYEAKLEDYVRAGEYEPKEIQRIVEQLIKDNKRAADIDSKEVQSIFLSLIRILKSEEIKRTVSPEVYKALSRSFKEFEKEFEDKVVDIVEAKAVLKKYETNLPDEKFAEKRILSKGGIKYEEGDIKPQGSSIRYEEDITDDSEFGALKTVADDIFDRTGDEASKLKPGTETSYRKFQTNPEILKIKIPEEARMDRDLREGLSVPAQKFAELQALIDKLTTFNKTNTRKTRYASGDELADLKEKSAKNQDKIERYQRELLIIKKTLSEEEVIDAVKVSEEITKRALDRRRYPLGVFVSRADKIAKEKAKIEKLRKKWQTIPAWETEAKSKLKKEAKISADYIKRLETETEEFVSRETKAKVAESTGSVVRWNKLTKAEQADAVYIGRGAGDRGKFGNPFPVGGSLTIKESINKYRSYLFDKIKSDPEYAKDLYALKGKKLACPGSEPNDSCHGAVILRAIKYLDENPELMKGK